MPGKHGTFLGTLSSFALILRSRASAQSGNAGAVRGTVTDPSGAVIPGATVHLANSISGLDRTVTTDATASSSCPISLSIHIKSLSRQRASARSPRVSEFVLPSEPH